MGVLVVVVATDAEAEHVPARLRTVITGIGKTAAAVATTRAIVEERPSRVINVGSPGRSATVLASGDVFATDPEVRVRLAQRAHLVDVEGYGVAYAAAELGVPVTLVEHVSDNADETALAWVGMVSASARAVGEWLTGQRW